MLAPFVTHPTTPYYYQNPSIFRSPLSMIVSLFVTENKKTRQIVTRHIAILTQRYSDTTPFRHNAILTQHHSDTTTFRQNTIRKHCKKHLWLRPGACGKVNRAFGPASCIRPAPL